MERGLLNISEFVYLVWSLSPPKRNVVRWRNFARRRVPTMSKTSAGFYIQRSRRHQRNDIFQQKYLKVGQQIRSGMHVVATGQGLCY